MFTILINVNKLAGKPTDFHQSDVCQKLMYLWCLHYRTTSQLRKSFRMVSMETVYLLGNWNECPLEYSDPKGYIYIYIYIHILVVSKLYINKFSHVDFFILIWLITSSNRISNNTEVFNRNLFLEACTDVFLYFLQNFQEHLFWRTSVNGCLLKSKHREEQHGQKLVNFFFFVFCTEEIFFWCL